VPQSDEAVLEAVVLSQIDGHPPVVIRIHDGHAMEASLDFAEEARIFGAHGYLPVSQQWAPGTWDSIVVVVAVLFSLVGIGLMFLAYMLVADPAGTLTVIYRRSDLAGVP
jgi:hypothetical protein